MTEIKFTFANGHAVSGFTPAPGLIGKTLDAPEFDDSGSAIYQECRLERRIRKISPDCHSIGLKLTNTSDRTLIIHELEVMRFTSEIFPESQFEEYVVDRLARQKNDLPGPFSPAKVNRQMRDASFSSAEVTAGGGISWSEFDSPDAVLPTKFDADPGLVLTARDLPYAIFFGFDGQHKHLNNLEFSTVPDRSAMAMLRAVAEFDDLKLAPGESRETHNLIIECAQNRAILLRKHADRIASQYGTRHSPFRNIYCTWYFYGPNINENEVRDNIEFIVSRGIKLDVFQIDMGWENNFGDWETEPAKFPGGMAEIAGLIRAGGMRPGIWTAPLVISPESQAVKKYPSIVLRDDKGEPCIFKCDRGNCYTLDPFAPDAMLFLEEFYSRLKKWGYIYHKLDFMRAVFIHEKARFYRPNCNRAEAYHQAMTIIRKALGEDALINACGGLYEGSAGLADIIRSGADLRGYWSDKGSNISAYATRIKQNICRNFYQKLWTVDPDAIQLRRNTAPWAGDEKYAHLSIGRFTDDEAFSIAVNQFLAGGLVCVAERFKDLDGDRLELLEKIVPNFSVSPEYFGEWNDYLPEKMVSTFDRHEFLPPYHVVSLLNWNGDEAKTIEFKISELPCLIEAEKYAAFEFSGQRVLGVFTKNDFIRLPLKPHASALIRLTPLKQNGRILIGTNSNFSMGMEVREIAPDGKVIFQDGCGHGKAQCEFLDYQG